MKVFLSYSRKDFDSVVILYHNLLENDYLPWMDLNSNYPGESWEWRLKKEIRKCDVFLTVLSKSSVKHRGYLNREISLIRRLIDRENIDKKVMSVKLEPCELSFDFLHSFPVIELYRRGRFEPELLLEFLKQNE